MSSKLRDRIREATADAILAAAEEVFSEKGLHAAKVEEIATQAGVSVGTLYNYFPDREGLLKALLETRKGEIAINIEEAMEKTAAEPFETQLRAFFAAVFSSFDAHRQFFTILFQGEAAKDKSSGGPREAMRAIYGLASALIERGIAAGALRPESADLLPGILTSLVRSALIISMYDPSLKNLSDRTDDFARFFLQGAGKRS